jgi:SAM-dependent methyltransferase
MGDRVGREGSVVAVDLKVDYLADLDPSRFDVRQGDAASRDLGADFDVSHCRYMLIHHPNPRAVIDQMFCAMKPGGRAVIEEPDFSVSRSGQGVSPGSPTVHCAIRTWFEGQALNAALGAALPGMIRAAGFADVKVEVEEHLCSGNSPVAKVMGASVEALREKYVATGETTDAALDAYVKDAADPSIRCHFYTTVRVVGRKP